MTAPLFADTALARRLEQAECEMSCAIARTMRGRHGAEGLMVPVAGGAAVFVRPGSPMNKLIGLGFDGPPDAGALDAIEQAFAARAAPLQAEVSTLADPATGAALTRRGYVLMGFENVLGMRLAATGERTLAPPPPIVVEEVPPGAEERWGALAVEGFSHPDETPAQAPQEVLAADVLAHVIEDVLHETSFRRFIARFGRVLLPAPRASASPTGWPPWPAPPRCPGSGAGAFSRRCWPRACTTPARPDASWRRSPPRPGRDRRRTR